jgi:hypothetical protein
MTNSKMNPVAKLGGRVEGSFVRESYTGSGT